MLPLLLLAPDAGVQPPGGRQLLRPLPLLRQLHPRPRPRTRTRAAAALAGGRVLHLHAGGVCCENLQKLPANVIYSTRADFQLEIAEIPRRRGGSRAADSSNQFLEKIFCTAK